MNTVRSGVLTYQPNLFDWITSTDRSKLRLKVAKKYLFDKYSWSFIIEESSLDYDDKVDKLLLEGFTLPCLHSDDLCKRTLKHPYNTFQLTLDLCLFFSYILLYWTMSELNIRYWLKTKVFFKANAKNLGKIIEGKRPTVFPHTNSTRGTNTPGLSRLEIFSKKIFRKKLSQMHTTQYPDMFVT